jgi:hypothetical protein
MSALISSTVQSISIRAGTSNKMTATYIANTYAEELILRPDSLIVDESPVCVDSDGRDNPMGSFNRSLSVDRSIDSELAEITVTVDYSWAFGKRKTTELVTFVYKGN